MLLKLELDAQLGTTYKSLSQKARVITEGWAERELYCFHCSSDELQGHRANRAVEDLLCPECDFRYQLKAKRGRMSGKVANSAYGKKMEAIRENRAPHYVFMGYDPAAWRVTQCFVVPGPFVTPQVVQARTPLRKGARRAGWVGSTIDLAAIPPHGRIQLLDEGRSVSPKLARQQFAQAMDLGDMSPQSRGWFSEVLWAMDRLGKGPGDTIRLEELYALEPELAKRHPRNRHIQEKLRQQMQETVRRGYTQRVRRGVYELMDPPTG